MGLVAGVALGIFVHCSMALLGISYVLAKFPRAFVAIKLIGALYLGYLGLKSLRAFYLDIKGQSGSGSTAAEAVAAGTLAIAFK